jgi:hypothetical protein
MAETETVVEIKQEPPAETTEVVVETKKAPKVEPKIVTADEGVDDLKAQVERSKAEHARRMQEADRQIAAARQTAIDAEKEVAVVKTSAVATVIDSLAKDKEAAKRDYKAAMEAGDFDKAADAQDRIATAASRIVEAERGKIELETQAKQPRQPLAQPLFQDHVESVARSMGSQRSADWVRRHPEHIVGNALSPKVLAAHYNAVDNGMAPDSDEYFAYIDRSLGATRAAPATEERERPPTAAPVARDVPQSPSAQRPGIVRLSASEVATARALDMSLEDYARHKRALIEEGKIGRAAS